MKKMNLFRVTLGLLICSKAWGAGGVGSGGGVLISGNPVSASQVEKQILYRSRPLVVGYLQAREYEYYQALKDAKQPSDLDRKLFGGSESVLSRLLKLKIEVRDSTACIDRDGGSFDGSAIDPSARSICISTFRIAPKVNENSMQYEVPALILHEISHLMGTDEAQAVELQNDFIEKNYRLNFAFGEALPDQMSAVWQTREGFGILMDRLENSVPSCKEADFITHHIHELRAALKLTSGEVSWLDAASADDFSALRIKARAVANLVCSWDQSLEPEKRTSYLTEYESGFNSNPSVEAGQYGASAWPGLGWNGLGLSHITLKKCSDTKCIQNEVEDIWSALMDVLVKVHSLSKMYFEKL